MKTKKIFSMILTLLLTCSILPSTISKTDSMVNASENSQYNYYASDKEFAESIFPGFIIKSYDEENKKIFEKCTEVCRGKYGIPNEMNCTLVCMTNLIIYYRTAHNMPSNATTYCEIYKYIVNTATQKYGYNSSDGLYVFNQKGLLKDAMEYWGFEDVNIDTQIINDNVFFSGTLHKEQPYIISSSDKFHSLIVYGFSEIYTIAIDPSNYLEYGSLNTKLYIYDPSGYSKNLYVSPFVRDTGFGLTFEQILYVKSCTPAYLSGDINNNGVVSAVDMTYMKKFLLGKIELNSQQRRNADVNSDGRINAVDMVLLQKLLLES